MCDFSLGGIPNRLAEVNDELETYFFRTGCMGLAATIDVKMLQKRPRLIPAVCVPPGARLRLSGIPAGMRREYRIGETEEVEFVQTSIAANRPRDAVRFENGLVLHLCRFCPRVCATVLGLGAGEGETKTLAAAFEA